MCKKIMLILVSVSIAACSNVEVNKHPKTKLVAVTKHPEKGTMVYEVGKDIPKNKYYDQDMHHCSLEAFAGGVDIGNKVSTDETEIYDFLDETSKFTIQAVKDQLLKRKKKKLSPQDEFLKQEADRVIQLRWSCMEGLGWSKGVETVPVESESTEH